jgi:hypothetical protein
MTAKSASSVGIVNLFPVRLRPVKVLLRVHNLLSGSPKPEQPLEDIAREVGRQQ